MFPQINTEMPNIWKVTSSLSKYKLHKTVIGVLVNTNKVNQSQWTYVNGSHLKSPVGLRTVSNTSIIFTCSFIIFKVWKFERPKIERIHSCLAVSFTLMVSSYLVLGVLNENRSGRYFRLNYRSNSDEKSLQILVNLNTPAFYESYKKLSM